MKFSCVGASRFCHNWLRPKVARLREGVRLCVKLFEHQAFRDMVEDRITPADADLASDAALDSWVRMALPSVVGRTEPSAMRISNYHCTNAGPEANA